MNQKHNENATILGLHFYYIDPAAAIVHGGKVLAYSEEERHTRIKHSPNTFPIRSIKSCLKLAGITAQDVDYISIHIDLDAFTDGTVEKFYASINKRFDVDPGTDAWQKKNLYLRNKECFTKMIQSHWIKEFGKTKVPELICFPHHYTHAFLAHMQSSFETSICFTSDGSGDTECTTLWECRGDTLTLLKKIEMPHSLGWFYSAITEYLGFEAKDEEYKVMGLASYGAHNADLEEKIKHIIKIDREEGQYTLDPKYIHYGEHSFSNRFTDALVDLFGKNPRRDGEEVTQWHRDLAFETQVALEHAAISMVDWGIHKTGITSVCVSGGTGLNVKMNSAIFNMPTIKNIFPHPLCADNGAACGSALLASHVLDKAPVEKLTTLALGHQESPAEIEKVLVETKTSYEVFTDNELFQVVAKDLSEGKVVGWFQGRMEAGPRALGHRSIIADPRYVDSRDKVNSVIKYREMWRPFCPSILSEEMHRFFKKYTHAPFMIIAFEANETLARMAPAIVHIDGTSRVQEVIKENEPRYHKLISAFNDLTGVPVLLNTSFNVKGEPIVCTSLDALRTFASTGMDILVLENFVIRKQR